MCSYPCHRLVEKQASAFVSDVTYRSYASSDSSPRKLCLLHKLSFVMTKIQQKLKQIAFFLDNVKKIVLLTVHLLKSDWLTDWLFKLTSKKKNIYWTNSHCNENSFVLSNGQFKYTSVVVLYIIIILDICLTLSCLRSFIRDFLITYMYVNSKTHTCCCCCCK